MCNSRTSVPVGPESRVRLRAFCWQPAGGNQAWMGRIEQCCLTPAFFMAVSVCVRRDNLGFSTALRGCQTRPDQRDAK